MIKLKLKPNDTLELRIKWYTRQTNWDTRQTKRGNQPNQILKLKLKQDTNQMRPDVYNKMVHQTDKIGHKTGKNRTPTKLDTEVETKMGHRPIQTIRLKLKRDKKQTNCDTNQYRH